jgi:signal recognition particle subunit SEC65
MAELAKKANIIYPAYLNKNRTVARGRRIPLQFAVSDPKPNEVVDALFSLKGFQAQAEVKPYCRELDKEAVPWRVRYLNTNPSRNNLNNKRQILVACAKRINEVRAKSGPSTTEGGAGGGGGGGSGSGGGGSGKQKKKK